MWRDRTKGRCLAVFAVAGILAACGDVPLPKPGQVGSASTPRPLGALSGVVFETTSQGKRPVPNARVAVGCEYYDDLCTSYEVVTDGSGRYGFTGLKQFGRVSKVVVADSPTGLFQACAVHPTIGEETTEDIELVQAGAPPTTARSPTLSGTVFETTASGRHPVAGITLVFSTEAILGELHDAFTSTDAGGQYRLCNLSPGAGELWASCIASNSSVQAVRSKVAIGGDTVLDIDVTSIREKC